ncbi:MAG: pilus assembly protein [Methylobacterium mesophilicum]|nr:pilus assembly protein [Methylobacterium mesophilicum]
MSERGMMTEFVRPGLRRFLRDRRGVAAVEFAILAPVLFCMYFLTMEAGQAIETDKKVGRVGSMVADLVTQQQSGVPMTREQLTAIMRIGTAIVQPYNRSTPEVVVTAIQMSDSEAPEATVAWSGQLVNDQYSRPYSPGSKTTVPDRLLTRKGFLIRVESRLGYKPVITWSASEQKTLGFLAPFNQLNMSETYYLRPRQTNEIPCPAC